MRWRVRAWSRSRASPRPTCLPPARDYENHALTPKRNGLRATSITSRLRRRLIPGYDPRVRVLPIVISFVCLAVAAAGTVGAKPSKLKIAVAPLAGDSGNKIGNAVVDALTGK